MLAAIPRLFRQSHTCSQPDSSHGTQCTCGVCCSQPDSSHGTQCTCDVCAHGLMCSHLLYRWHTFRVGCLAGCVTCHVPSAKRPCIAGGGCTGEGRRVQPQRQEWQRRERLRLRPSAGGKELPPTPLPVAIIPTHHPCACSAPGTRSLPPCRCTRWLLLTARRWGAVSACSAAATASLQKSPQCLPSLRSSSASSQPPSLPTSSLGSASPILAASS